MAPEAPKWLIITTLTADVVILIQTVIFGLALYRFW